MEDKKQGHRWSDEEGTQIAHCVREGCCAALERYESFVGVVTKRYFVNENEVEGRPECPSDF